MRIAGRDRAWHQGRRDIGQQPRRGYRGAGGCGQASADQDGPGAQCRGRVTDNVRLLAGRADQNARMAGPEFRDRRSACRPEVDDGSPRPHGRCGPGGVAGDREQRYSRSGQTAWCAHHGPEHGTILSVPVVLIVVAAAIVIGGIAVALGRGGEMARFTADFAPVDLDDIDKVTATDVALLRPPSALWGYHMQATDQAFGVIARTLTDRDVQIATLQRQLAEAQHAAQSAQQATSPPWESRMASADSVVRLGQAIRPGCRPRPGWTARPGGRPGPRCQSRTGSRPGS